MVWRGMVQYSNQDASIFTFSARNIKPDLDER